MVTFNRRTNKRDEEFLGGKSPYEGTLGPNKSADIFSRYAGGLKKTNPRQATFDSDSRTFSDVAPRFANRRLMIFGFLLPLLLVMREITVSLNLS